MTSFNPFIAVTAITDSAVFNPKSTTGEFGKLIINHPVAITSKILIIQGRADANCPWVNALGSTTFTAVSGTELSTIVPIFPEMRISLSAIVPGAGSVSVWFVDAGGLR